jgi:hypothetical protein
MSVPEIVRGQWLSLRRVFGRPVLAVVCAECFFVVTGVREIGDDRDTVAFWVTAWGCGIFMLFADIIGLTVVGVWQSASAKFPGKASGATAFRILALPWLAFLGLVAVWVVMEEFFWTFRTRDPGWFFWVAAWTLFGLGANLLFGLSAWRAIHSRFRQVASQQTAEGGLAYRLGRLFRSRRGRECTA